MKFCQTFAESVTIATPQPSPLTTHHLNLPKNHSNIRGLSAQATVYLTRTLPLPNLSHPFRGHFAQLANQESWGEYRYPYEPLSSATGCWESKRALPRTWRRYAVLLGVTPTRTIVPIDLVVGGRIKSPIFSNCSICQVHKIIPSPIFIYRKGCIPPSVPARLRDIDYGARRQISVYSYSRRSIGVSKNCCAICTAFIEGVNKEDDNSPIDVLNYVLSEEFSRVPSLTFHLIIAGIQRVDPDETKQSYLKLSRLAAFTNGICQDLMATTTTEKFGTTGHNLGTANLDNIIFLGSL